MNASKENAAKAIEHLETIGELLLERQRADHSDILGFLEEFLDSACAKLPSEAAFAADKARRKKSADIDPPTPAA